MPAYLVHIADEWFAGFPAWMGSVVGAPLPTTAYIVINGIALLLLVIGIRAAVRSEEYGWVPIALATIALINTLAHAVGAALTRSYSPGLISAAVLYVPLGGLVMIRAADQSSPAQMSRGIPTGIAIHVLVFGVAFWSTRF